MRLILDANVVVSGIFWFGPPHQVLQRCIDGEETLLVSPQILAEYRDTLTRFPGVNRKWDTALAEIAEMVVPQALGTICRDPKDEKYLEAAVGGNADVIVSGDSDMLVLKEVHGIPILSPRAFLSF